MINQQPNTVEFQDHLQEDITADDILDDVLGDGNLIDDLNDFKGIVSHALGTLGFKFSFVIILLFNFVYTVHNAFAKTTKTEVSVISFNNCSCDSRDKLFYSVITYGFISLWIVFILICALYSIFKFIYKLPCTNDTAADSSNEEITTRKEIPEKHFWFLKREMRKLTTMVFYLNKQSLHNKEISSADEITSAVKYLLAHMKHKFLKVADPPENKCYFVTDYVCKIYKCALVTLQFFLRLPIVPLLLLQWLDEYSWNCVIGSVKNYCKDTVVGYMFDQSMVISCLYICILLAIIIARCIQYMPVNRLLSGRKSTLHNQSKSRSKWCLLIEVDHTIFLTNIGFIMIIALIYTSILSQFTYVAITEAERDVNSDKTFNIGEKWFNRSISGGVSNSVLWKCIEISSSPYFKAIFGTLLFGLIAIVIFYAIMSLVMAFVNYQRVKRLIYHYYGDKMCSNSMQHSNQSMQDDSKSIRMIVMILHKLFQLRYLGIPQNKIEHILIKSWNDAKVRESKCNSFQWYVVLFLIPTIELILILLLFLLVLTSYNIHPIGCFFTDVYYDESTNMVMLELMQGVHTYQQVAVVTSIAAFCILIFIKSFHIYHILASHPHQSYIRQHNIVYIRQPNIVNDYDLQCTFV